MPKILLWRSKKENKEEHVFGEGNIVGLDI